MSNLYERLTALCKAKGVTGAKMCSEIGYNSKNLLTELKSGRKKSVSADVANRMSNYFGVSVSYLLGETDEFEEPEYSQVEEIQNELFEQKKLLFDLSNKATPNDLKKIVKIAQAIIGEDE